MAARTLERRAEVIHRHPANGEVFFAVILDISRKHRCTKIRLIPRERGTPQFILDLKITRLESENPLLRQKPTHIAEPNNYLAPLNALIRASKPLTASRSTTLSPTSLGEAHRNGAATFQLEPTPATISRTPEARTESTQKGINTRDKFFEDVFEEYQDKIYNCIYRLMGNRDEARDLTQDAFLKAYAALPKINRELKMGPWLYRIAINLSLDQLRRRKLISWEPLEDAAQIKAVDPTTPEKEALRTEQKELVHRALEKLPPKYRATLVLREYRDMSCEEIAEVLGTTRSTVKSLLYRSREAFRIVIAELDSEEASARGGITGNHQVDRVEALKNEGLDDSQIAERLGVKKTTIDGYNYVLRSRGMAFQGVS